MKASPSESFDSYFCTYYCVSSCSTMSSYGHPQTYHSPSSYPYSGSTSSSSSTPTWGSTRGGDTTPIGPGSPSHCSSTSSTYIENKYYSSQFNEPQWSPNTKPSYDLQYQAQLSSRSNSTPKGFNAGFRAHCPPEAPSFGQPSNQYAGSFGSASESNWSPQLSDLNLDPFDNNGSPASDYSGFPSSSSVSTSFPTYQSTQPTYSHGFARDTISSHPSAQLYASGRVISGNNSSGSYPQTSPLQVSRPLSFELNPVLRPNATADRIPWYLHHPFAPSASHVRGQQSALSSLLSQPATHPPCRELTLRITLSTLNLSYTLHAKPTNQGVTTVQIIHTLQSFLQSKIDLREFKSLATAYQAQAIKNLNLPVGSSSAATAAQVVHAQGRSVRYVDCLGMKAQFGGLVQLKVEEGGMPVFQVGILNAV
jgi:hypothetical protein